MCVGVAFVCVCVCAPVFVADMSVCTSERMCVSPCTCVSGSCLCTHLTMHVCECVLLVRKVVCLSTVCLSSLLGWSGAAMILCHFWLRKNCDNACPQ